MRKRTKRRIRKVFVFLLLLGGFFGYNYYYNNGLFDKFISFALPSYNIGEVPDYSGKAYVIINNNNPDFKEDEINTNTFEKYSNLDFLGRCGVAYANVSRETMPTKERDYIGMVKPSGWQYSKYNFIDGKYLYNRCHLIAYQLTGENANKKNLITCTRYANATTMLKFENKVAGYVKRTGNHVLYRVTPIFKGTELVARGIQMEALSVEDDGLGIKYNVYIYNIQKGISIDYRTGNNQLTKKDN